MGTSTKAESCPVMTFLISFTFWPCHVSFCLTPVRGEGFINWLIMWKITAAEFLLPLVFPVKCKSCSGFKDIAVLTYADRGVTSDPSSQYTVDYHWKSHLLLSAGCLLLFIGLINGQKRPATHKHMHMHTCTNAHMHSTDDRRDLCSSAWTWEIRRNHFSCLRVVITDGLRNRPVVRVETCNLNLNGEWN